MKAQRSTTSEDDTSPKQSSNAPDSTNPELTNNLTPFVNQHLTEDDISTDPDYTYTEPPLSEQKFQTTPSAMDKELNNLAQEGTILPEEEMLQFLNDDAGNEVEEPNKIEIMDVDEEEDRNNDNLESPHDLEPGDLSPNALDKLTDESENQQDETLGDDTSIRLLRRKRTSRFDMPDKQTFFEKMPTENIQVTMSLADFLGISPEYRKDIHERTKGILVARAGPMNAPKYEVNETVIINPNEHTNDADQIYIPAKIQNRDVTLKYDTALQVSLINPKTLDGLNVKWSKLSPAVRIIGVNKDEVLVEKGVAIDIFIHFIPLTAHLLVHDATPVGQILLGLPFQNEHKLSIGFNNDDKRELRFKVDGKVLKFPVQQVGRESFQVNQYPEIQCNEATSANQLEELLTTSFNGSKATAEEMRYFISKCADVTDVFYVKGGHPGRLKPEVHPPVQIKLRDKNAFWRCKSIPLGIKRPAAVEILSEMLKNGQLQYSSAAYRNPWFLIPKKDGRHRMLIDLRELNKHVELEGGHPQSTDELTSELSGRLFNTLIDVQNAYFQVPLDPTTNDVTSFNSPLGLLKYAVLPQGYLNLVSEFSSILQKILSPVAKDVICFIDDIAICGPTVEDLSESLMKEHLDKVHQVLQLLAHAGLKINPAKLKVAVEDCEFLGYRITPEGKTIIRGQVDALTNYPRPTTQKKMESFLGLVNYYRQLIVGFAELTAPLYDLILKAKEHPKHLLEWDDQTINYFQHIIRVLTSCPVLQPFNDKQITTIHTDASTESWGGVLQNTDAHGVTRMVLCYSGKFHGSERHYTIYEKELFSIYLTLNAIQPLLVGYKDILYIYCDNKALVTVLDKPLENSHFVNRTYKWLNYIRSFNYMIIHIDGKRNVIADALSRCHLSSLQAENYAVEEVRNLFRNSLDPTILAEVNTVNIITNANNSYKGINVHYIQNYLKTLEIPTTFLKSKDLKRFTNRALEFYLQDGKLYKRGKDGSYTRKVITNSNEVRNLFQLTHDARGHLGLEACFNLLNCHAFIPNLYRRLKAYTTSCLHCQKQGPATLQRDPLYFHLPAGLFHTVVCDCVKIGNIVIVVARDEFLAWAEARILPELSAEAVADFIFDAFIARVGSFHTLKTDNGPEFANRILRRLLDIHGIKATYSVPYHPQGNGMIEASHKRIIRFMQLLPPRVNFQHALLTALWVDRTTVRKRTGFSPQYLVYGFEGHSPLRSFLDITPKHTTYTEDELFKFRFRQLYHRTTQIESALDTQRNARERQKVKFDERYDTTTILQVGDLVLVTDKNQGPQGKLAQRWAGPYKVWRKLSRIYHLQSLSGIKILRCYTREMIKPYVLRSTQI
ncbi:hypothetical protein LELG_04884 [Lodderomyces elongisporus NRRL YB-4239]|uniref:Uncharacterized protein n=1 Tax=Lodderomyces elongisporus (strain ATCC 11503 / CBS 2605 / JCM 1781 / NBRC 1676 / NRRL YB-4239) TaxID=379508 RepID=A5E5J5_LODEL|nr:hypothetical protein LELG_04884 [Lodderomyces elongisporus NRRL YB-4239]